MQMEAKCTFLVSADLDPEFRRGDNSGFFQLCKPGLQIGLVFALHVEESRFDFFVSIVFFKLEQPGGCLVCIAYGSCGAVVDQHSIF